MPSSSKPNVPAYVEKLYDLCDVFDAMASTWGAAATEASAERLLGQVAAAYPRAAETALGSVKFKEYKQAAGAPSPALLAKLTALLAVRSEDEISQALDQLAIQPVVGAKLSDGQKPAAHTTKSAKVEAELAKTARFFGDDGRPLFRPLRDEHGNPLP